MFLKSFESFIPSVIEIDDALIEVDKRACKFWVIVVIFLENLEIFYGLISKVSRD